MIVKSVVLGWLGRRIPDWGGQFGGWIAGLTALYLAMSPAQQDMVLAVLHGNWEAVTLPAAVGFVVWAGSQVMSFRATVKPQVVTEDGKKVAMKELPKTTQTEVKQKVEVAVEKNKQPNLLERIFKRT